MLGIILYYSTVWPEHRSAVSYRSLNELREEAKNVQWGRGLRIWLDQLEMLHGWFKDG